MKWLFKLLDQCNAPGDTLLALILPVTILKRPSRVFQPISSHGEHPDFMYFRLELPNIYERINTRSNGCKILSAGALANVIWRSCRGGFVKGETIARISALSAITQSVCILNAKDFQATSCQSWIISKPCTLNEQKCRSKFCYSCLWYKIYWS